MSDERTAFGIAASAGIAGRGLVLRAGGDGVMIERDKGVRWMPWRQEAMKDVARCEKPRGDASDR